MALSTGLVGPVYRERWPDTTCIATALGLSVGRGSDDPLLALAQASKQQTALLRFRKSVSGFQILILDSEELYIHTHTPLSHPAYSITPYI